MQHDPNANNIPAHNKLQAKYNQFHFQDKIEKLNHTDKVKVKLRKNTIVYIEQSKYDQYKKQAAKLKIETSEFIKSILDKKYFPNAIQNEKKTKEDIFFNTMYEKWNITKEQITGHKGRSDKEIVHRSLLFIKECLSSGITKQKMREKFHINDHKINKAIKTD